MVGQPLRTAGLLGFAKSSPAPQSRHPYGGHLPDPSDPVRGSGLLREEGGRGQDQERRHPFAQAEDLQHRLPSPGLRRPAIRGPGGQAGTTHSQRDRLCTLTTGSSAKSLPDPPNLRHSQRPMAPCPHVPGRLRIPLLDSKRIRWGAGDKRPDPAVWGTLMPRSGPGTLGLGDSGGHAPAFWG